MSWLIHRWLTLFGISLLVFKDCESLFLRHYQTGKCITKSKDLVYNKPTYAKPYWVAMIDDCLDNKAQFRYLNTELLQHIETGGTFASTTSNNYLNRLVVYQAISTKAQGFQNNTDHRLKQTAAGSLSFYPVNVCAEPSKTTIYVDRKTTCGTPAQKFTFGSVTSFSTKMKNVGCSPIQHMVVKRADYGDFNNNGVFDGSASNDTKCSPLTNCQVKSLCGGNRSCELTIDNDLLPSEYCSDTSKEIYTEYTCVDTYSSSTITAAPKISLTNQNRGNIEIRNGRTWRRVLDENWDKNRQKMLCQHLGFEETADNNIEIRKIGSGKLIATGDLICYSRQASESSCCIHLQLFTSNSSTEIPYVECKICDKPLLHDTQTFPDSIFSGSGDSNNDYKRARITSGGWCPLGSGTKYLMLDLQKQYHITQVVVMADAGQFRWSGSYSLKYSHDTTYKYTEQIKGNPNGYQASITSLNIYNVRYMKIESTGNPKFCLRIELCGEVQTPAPVYDINVAPSDYSARVTWKVPTAPEDSSYITHYRIYLDGEFRKTISRATYGTGFNIFQLKPNTEYTVGIDTEDGSSQRGTNVTKTFSTKQAESVNPVAISDSSLNVTIAKPPTYIKEVMVIVQSAKTSSTLSENLRTIDLKPYQENMKDPYVTAYLKADVLPLTFVIGDGKEYISEKQKYFNQPLKQCSNYIVFLRFFENQISYYSTEWSSNVKTLIKAPVECVNNKNSEESNNDNSKIRMDLLIPLAILALCFLLSLGVIVYQRRLIQINNRHPCQKRKFDSPNSNTAMGGVQAAPRDSYMNDDTVYESPDSDEYVISVEQNETESKPEISTGQESSTYMSLKDNREPGNFYQSLQSPGTSADPHHTKGGDDQAVEYENRAFNANVSASAW